MTNVPQAEWGAQYHGPSRAPQVEAALSSLELDINSSEDSEDPSGSVRRIFLFTVECERQSCGRAILQGFSSIASLLLAHNESTIEDIVACIRSKNPPLAYTKGQQVFWKVVYAGLTERKEGMTKDFLETVQSGTYRPFPTLGDFGAHSPATLQQFWALCSGNCSLQGPRSYVIYVSHVYVGTRNKYLVL
jgi:hypothetical protein